MLVDHLQKAKKEYKNIKKQEIDVYENELDKACFQQDMPYAIFKDLTRRTASDKILRQKVLILLKSKIWLISKGSCFNGL